MRDLTKEFTIPNGVNSLNATASLDPFFGPFESVEEAYNLVPENKRKVGKIFAVYLDSTESNVELYYWITDSAGAEWRPIPLVPKIDTDRVVSLGAITVNGSVVTIGLSSGGTNSVEINNAIYSRYEPISFTTDPIIVAGNFRKDIIEARADSTVFYLKKGVESANPVPPAVTDGALFISEVLVTSTGVSAGALNSVVTDSTMKGDGTSGNPLGLSVSKNAEIAGKISKQGINLGDTGNIPEMKTGDISGIYRGDPASNPVYPYSPFFHMVAEDTYAQIHLRYEDGEMSYRAGTAVSGYTPIRISWDTGNLVNPATQGWVTSLGYIFGDTATNVGFINGNKAYPYIRHSDMTVVELATSTGVNQQVATKQDKSMFSALVDKWIHFYDSATAKMQPIIKLVTGAINQLEFDGRMKLAALILPPNTNPNVANRLWSDGTDVYYDDNLAIPNKLAKDKQIYKIISGDVTLDNTYHNCICRITANCNITVPTGLRSDFISFFVVIGNYKSTFTASPGVIFYAPFGVNLRKGLTCAVQQSSTNNFDLTGNLSTW